MLCRRCKNRSTKGSEEHIIVEGLGGKTTTSLVFCEECNRSFSQIDRTLVEQFAFAKNLLEIRGKRGIAPRVMMTDPNGNPVMLRPGGKPVYLKPQSEEKTEEDRKTIKISIPLHIWEQYKTKLEKQYNIKIDEASIKRISEHTQLEGTLSFGGLDALRAVAKMVYSLVCDHLARHDLDADLSEIEDYIFRSTEVDKLCLLDDRPEIYEEVDNLSNIIAVHFNSESSNIIGSITILGSFGFSVLLSRNYRGESYTIRMKNNSINPKIKDEFEKKPLERVIGTFWLLSRPNFSDKKRWVSMGQSFSEKYMSKITKLHREMVFNEITADCMKQAGFFNSDKRFITEEMIGTLSECVAKKIVKHF